MASLTTQREYVPRKPNPSFQTLQPKIRRTCNICGQTLRSSSPYARFCESCRTQSEAFRYVEWLVGAY